MVRDLTKITIAGRYRILRELGKGGMGVVYLVEDLLKAKNVSRNLALKFLPNAASALRVEEFKREFSLLTRLHHPFLAPVFDLGFDPKRQLYFFTSTFVEGIDLFTATRNLRLESINSLLQQSCVALAYIHRQGILHNDLKPSNILVQNHFIKILDFGISSILDEQIQIERKSFVGTPGYVAPEIIRGEKPSVAGDLFSLGITFFKILVGKIPFEADSSVQIFQQMSRERVADIRMYCPDLPAALVSIINQLTAFLPRERQQSAEEVLEQLKRWKKAPDVLPDSVAQDLHSRTATFVGRAEIMEEVLGQLDKVLPSASGPCVSEKLPVRLLQVSGTSGMGKSRLLKELGSRLQLRDMPFCLCHCGKTQEFSYGPWAEIFRQVLAIYDGREDARIDFLESFFFGNLELVSPVSPASKARTPEEFVIDDRFRIFHALTGIVNEVALSTPLVLAFDDLDLMDADGLSLFRFMLRFIKGSVAFLITSKPHSPSALQEMVFEAEAKIFSLHAFNPAETKSLISSILENHDLPKGFLDILLNHCTGNPKKIIDTLRLLTDRGFLQFHNRGWELAGAPTQIIKKIKSFLEQSSIHIPRLLPSQKAMLDACSIFHHSFSFEDVNSILDQGPGKIVVFLEDMAKCGIFERLGAKHYIWLDHAVRKSFYEEHESKQLILAWHKRHADYLQALVEKGNPTLTNLERLITHAFAANQMREGSKRALQLGKIYLEKFSLVRAEHHLVTAKNHLDNLDSASIKELYESLVELDLLRGQDQNALGLLHLLVERETDPVNKAETLLKICFVQRNLGQYSEANQTSRKCLALLGQTGNEILRARVLAQQSVLEANLGNNRQALENLNLALSLISSETHPFRVAQIRNIRGTFYLNSMRDFPRAKADYLESLHGLEKASEPRLLASVYHNLGVVLGQLGEVDDEKKYYIKALEAAQALGDMRRILFCLNSVASWNRKRARIPSAQAGYEEALELARFLSDRTMEITLLYNLGQCHSLQGRYEESITLLLEGIAKARELNQQDLARYGSFSLAALWLSIGEVIKTQEILKDISDSKSENQEAFSQGILNQLNGELCSLEGRQEEALNLLQKAKDIFQNIGLVEQATEIDCQQMEVKLQAQQRLGNLELNELQKNIEFFQKNRNGIGLLRAHLVWLTYLTENQAELTLHFKQVEHIEHTYKEHYLLLPEFNLKLHILLGKVYAHCEMFAESLTAIEKSEDELNKIVSNLRPDHRRIYLEDSRRQEWLATFQYFRSLEEIQKVELARLEERNRNGDDLFEWIRGSLAYTEDFKGLLQWVLKSLSSLALSKRAAFYFQQTSGLHRQAVYPPDDGSWITDAKRDQMFRAAGEAVLFSGLPKIVEEGTVFPAFFAEGKFQGLFPLGTFVVEAKLSQHQVLERIKIFLRFVSELLHQTIRINESKEKGLRLASSLTSVKRLLSTNKMLLAIDNRLESIIGGRAPSMARFLKTLKSVIPSITTVLIAGETGTGKELVAQAIHHNGPLASCNFIAVNCAVVPQTLAESHFFGHVKGAFTDAIEDQVGIFMRADGGTLFLDEIADMPLDLQVKILRVLEDGQVRPLGSQTSRKVSFRLIAASSKNLEELCEQGKFRFDLYQRIHVITLRIPPLRERREDIPLLVKHFLRDVAAEMAKSPRKISTRALKHLTYYSWPGNVRQLRNVIETIYVLENSKKIDLSDLPAEIREKNMRENRVQSLDEAKAEFYRNYMIEALKASDGNLVLAGKMTGMKSKSIYFFLKQYYPEGIKKK